MKVFFSVALLGAMLLLAGCNSGIGVGSGFGYTAPGLIFSNGVQGGVSELNIDALKRPYKHISRVKGESEQANVLLLITLGDASIEAAQTDALSKVKGADALINRNFDIEHFSVLGLFTTAKLRVTGDAIKYTDK